MDGNLLKEIHYLTRLIEQHKKKPPEASLQHQEANSVKPEKCANMIHRSQQTVKSSKESSYDSIPSKGQVKSTNVYVNPNFKTQKPVIHINPNVRLKPLVHINPKMIQNSSPKNLEVNSLNITTETTQNIVQSDIKRSVYVNPKLMKKLCASTECKPPERKQAPIQETTSPACSRLKFVKSANSHKTTQKKPNNSSVLILSQRKLIRVRRGSKGSLNTSQTGLHKTKKPLLSPFHKNKVASQKIVKCRIADGLQRSSTKESNILKIPFIKPKVNKYRIDRTIASSTKTKKQMSSGSKRILSNTMELVTIGGIVYKSSKNQLVRRSYGLKKKRVTNVKNDKFIITTNGKKLCRLKSTKDNQAIPSSTIGMAQGTKPLPNNLQKLNYKNNISNKVKQRSIQILRNKMRKNNQPCLIFQRFGFCANYEKGTCPKLHDKKQISLCKKFLQGNCLLDSCPLSHDVGPEKMPTCKYFLEGCCTKDACPYRHIKVSSNTPICIEFLKGYCAKGQECKRRHENLCPEFDKTGKCNKGKYCPYPHKTQSSTTKQSDKYLKRKHNVPSTQVTTQISTTEDSSNVNHENRLRYYEQTGTLNEELEKKRENIMKKIKIMKAVEIATHSEEIISFRKDTSSSETIQNDCELEIISENKILKRPPIGSLPAYIPIN